MAMTGIPDRVQSAMHHSVGATGLSSNCTPRTLSRVSERVENHIPKNSESHTSVTVRSGVGISKDSRSYGAITPTGELLSPLTNGERGRFISLKREASILTPEKQQWVPTTTPFITTATTTKTRGTAVFPASVTTPLYSLDGYGGPSVVAQTQEMEMAHQRQTQEGMWKDGSSVASSQFFPRVVAFDTPVLQLVPEKIVFLIDRQDAYLKSFYYPNVLHIYDAKLNFGNAFDMIKKTKNVFKNTLFVMLCGTMSALKQDINEKCFLFQCKEPLYNYSLQEFKAPSLHEHLISEANNLRKNITEMDNCDVIFSGALPVKINCAETHEAAKHYSQTGHQVKPQTIRYESLYSELCSGLREFNMWAKADAASRGFPEWSLVDMFTTNDVENSSQHFTHPTQADGVTLTGECMVERRVALKAKLKETFLRVRKTSQGSKPLLPLPSYTANKKVEVRVPELCSYNPAASNPSSETSSDFVVLLADEVHRKILSTLVSRRVTLITEEKLTPNSIVKMIQNNYIHLSGNKTMWILCLGIHNFVDIKVSDLCSSNQCKEQLMEMSVEKSKGKINQCVQDAMSTIEKLKNHLKEAWPGMTVMVAPPMQAAVLCTDAFKSHSKSHEVATKYHLHLCKTVTFGFLRRFYMQLFDTWLNTVIKPEGGTCTEMMKNYITEHKNKCLQLVDGKLAHVKSFGKGWREMMSKVIFTNLKWGVPVTGLRGVQLSAHLSKLPYVGVVESSQSTGKTLTLPSQERPDEDDRLFQHVVVMGNQMPAELEEMCLKFSIHLVPERVTFDEAGKALIRKYEKFWPRNTLWVILTDVLHLANPSFKACRKEKCKYSLPIYNLKNNSIASKWDSCNKVTINNFISKVKEFSESLMYILGEESALFLPPVTPVFLMNSNSQEKHKLLHERYINYGKIAIVNGPRKKWKKTYGLLKQDWMKMLKPYLENYSVPKKILQLYTSDPKHDWIVTLGKLLVYFASASIDEGDAVFSDADLSSGEEDTENMAPPITTASTSTFFPYPFIQDIPSAQAQAAAWQGMQHKLGRTPGQQQQNGEAVVMSAAQNQQHAMVEEQQPHWTMWSHVNPMKKKKKNTAKKKEKQNIRKKRGHETPKAEKVQEPSKTKKRKESETERGQQPPKKKRNQGQKPPKTEKGQKPTKTEKSLEPHGEMIGQESADTKEGQETLKQGRAQETAKQEKRQAATMTKEGQETLKQGKSQVITMTKKDQETLKKGRAQDTTKQEKDQATTMTDKGQETSKQGKVQECSKQGKSQATTRKEKGQETPKQGKVQKSSKQGKSQASTRREKGQETPKQGKSQATTRTEKVHEPYKQGKGQEPYKQEKGQKPYKQEKVQEIPKQGKGQETSKQGKGQETPEQGKSQEIPMQGKGQETPRQGKGQETPKQGKGQEIPKQGKGQETPKQGKGQETHRQRKGQETPKQGKGQETHRQRKDQVTTKMEKCQETSMQGKGQETSMQEKGQETSMQGKGQETSMQEKGQETSMQGKGQETSMQGKGQETSMQGKGQETPKQGKGQETLQEKGEEAPKQGKGQVAIKKEKDEETVWQRKSQETSMQRKVLETLSQGKGLITIKIEKGQETRRHGNSQVTIKMEKNETPVIERSQVAIKMEGQKIPWSEESQQLHSTEKSQVFVKTEKGQDSVKSEEFQDIVKTEEFHDIVEPEEVQGHHERVKEGIEGEEASDAENDNWIILSETSKDDLSENEAPDDQDVGLQEGNHLSDHHEDTTSETLAQKQSLIPKAEDPLPKLSNNSSELVWIPDSYELQSDHGKGDAPGNMTENEPKQDVDEIGSKQDMDEGCPNQNDDSSDIEILSNPDSIETIPLDGFEEEVEEEEEEKVIFNVSEDYDLLKLEFGSDSPQVDCMESVVDTVSVKTKPAANPGKDKGPFNRKRTLSFSNRDSLTLPSSSNSNSFDSDPETKKLFMMVEENLNQSYQLKLQTFMQVPEAHQDFETRRAEFLKSYNKQYKGLTHCVNHRETAWRAFWESTVGKQLRDEWKKSKNELVEQFKAISRKSSSSMENQPKRVKRDESSEENHQSQSNNTSPQSSLTISQKQKFKSKSQNTSQRKKSNHSSSLESCMTEMTHYKHLIFRANKASPNSELKPHTYQLNMDKIMMDDTKRRAHLILSCFALLSELGRSLDTLAPAVVPIIKSVLDEGVHSLAALNILAKENIQKVMKMCAEKLRHLSDKAKGCYKEKLLQCSTDTMELLENVSTSLKNITVVESLDIPSIAQATAWQDSTYILQFIKDILASRGMHNPSKNILNELFLAVSSQHFNLAAVSPPKASPDPSK